MTLRRKSLVSSTHIHTPNLVLSRANLNGSHSCKERRIAKTSTFESSLRCTVDMHTVPKSFRCPDGTLRVVDYKTGKIPNLKYSEATNQRIMDEKFFQLQVGRQNFRLRVFVERASGKG